MTWLTRIKESFPHSVWLNPEPQKDWQYVESIKMVHTIFDGRMYPLSLDGLAEAMDFLRKRHNLPALPHM